MSKVFDTLVWIFSEKKLFNFSMTLKQLNVGINDLQLDFFKFHGKNVKCDDKWTKIDWMINFLWIGIRNVVLPLDSKKFN